MGDVLILADSTRSPEMRHEVPIAVPDAFLYAEHDGRRVVVVSSLEAARIGEADPCLEVIPYEAVGLDELAATGMEPAEAALQMHTRACRRLGITSASVPAGFPLELADRLRENGVEITPDRALFESRRRRKTATEIAGLRLAQRACEAALDAARVLLRRASANGTLMLDGEPLTSERLKAEVERVFTEHGAYADEFIVAHGAQTTVGHEGGHGPILPGEVLDSGFFHSLGHGVGLEVHERPYLGRVGDDLVPGDVIALEPGLYRAGYGGVRLEDIAIVTDDGIEVVTDYPYELEP